VRVLFVVVAFWWIVAWAAARLLVVRVDLPHADALVVLSGSSTYVERTRLAAELWKAGRAPEVVLTNDGQKGGWSSAEQRNPFFVERANRELVEAGVPARCVIALPQVVTGTHDEAVLVREYVESRGFSSILLVTSAYHSRRALWTAETVFAGSRVKIGLDSASFGQQTPSPATWWFHWAGWRGVAGEYVKLIYYYTHYRRVG
jgi:uncharacterized SAM-binding protein YcdF (DUF218 family)